VRETYRTGGFEDLAGYSRAVRVGAAIAVSATAATGPHGGADHPGDTYAQTRAAFARAIEGLEHLGGSLEHVLRTTILLAREADWQRAVDAHRELFADVKPANSTYYVAGFIPEGVLVEVELDAYLPR
jgi:enamine deaminase RidA (YjgF/YER057c/UK114 family)